MNSDSEANTVFMKTGSGDQHKNSLIQEGLLFNVAEKTKPDEGRIFAIGDIHGCSTALRTLIEAIDPRPEDTLVILGDFIDCGPNSKGVVEQLFALSNRCRLICLLGNHEEMLLNAVDSKSEYHYWLKLGGKETLRSYSPHSTDLDVIPADHVRFIRGCLNYFETETHIFVHANYDHERPMSHVSGTKLRWEHLDLVRLRPHYSGKTVVVGHTPQANGNVLDLGFVIGIDTDICREGWLTAIDVGTRFVAQTTDSLLRRFILRLPKTPSR